MFEHRHQPLVAYPVFIRRILASTVLAFGLIVIALAIGVVGYHGFEGLSWIDSLLNAAMILGGMGPVDLLHHPSAKLFAAWYALFSGLIFIGIAGVLFAPILHRILHRFHLEH